MTELHEALSCLGPVSWEDVPVSSTEQLREYAQDIFSKSKLIIETVPEQISSDDNDDNSNGNNADEPMSLPGAGLSASQYESLRKEWGKPLKMNNAKENPLNIPMYKLSGKDGKGAWFARRSVHRGLPFARWKAKMQIEIEETLKGREEEKRQGRTPENSVRGIGADAKLENVGIGNDGGSQNLGSIDVYKLSAQFPGPTTARDFVTMIMTTDSMPGEEGEEIEKDDNSFLVVSKPCIHPEVPPQNDYIRGQYESVEIIRELPVKPSQKENEANGATTGLESPASGSSRSTGSGSSTNNPNPVEWIMVTRSDPGGSVPRWMVERGTPKSITGDTVKFLNWASQPDVSDKQDTADIGEMTKDAETQQPIDSERANGRLSGIEGKSEADQQRDAIGTGNEGAKQLNQAVTDSRGTGLVNNQASNGLWNSVTSMLNNGFETYAPQAVFNYMPTHDDGNNTVPIQGEEDDDDASSAASDDSFTSAESKIAASILDQPVKEQSGSTNGLSLTANEEIAEITAKKDPQAKPSSKEKELAKLQTRKREVETQLTTIQSEIETLGGTSVKDTGTSDNESGRTSTSTSSATVAALEKTSVNPQKVVRDQKRIANLSRTEAKLNSQLRKIEAQQLKLVKKIEADQIKTTEREEKSRSKSEAESLRKEVQSLKEEVRELRGEREKWLDIIGRLQKENVKLAEKNG
ncbi:uncharacterized protein TRUGW13939_03735 [Talaromyces rugulosus]|uniref:DUF3074 domain-containing protein n=1 Tax=Talaromyces rugulosus TaxID=121627 RepID=A0A7H8QRM7_TALRU|nr:uncharacterized protein TRUGW13939_03735 [Talaromyces rugulosus]QKX56630.1 hypothetical protein TRUGW13939_03735 [Talaromyces rugulosus]